MILFQEIIGFSHARAESVYNVALERVKDAAQFLHPRNGQPGVSPHAPYTVSPTLVRSLANYAAEQQIPLAMHLAESAEELALLQDGSGPFRDLLDSRSMWDETVIPSGFRPLDYLKLVAAAPRSLIIHGNYLRADELEYLGQHRDRMSLIHCPRTHAKFAHPPIPWDDWKRYGVHFAIGTDSRASNPDLSIKRELQHLLTNQSVFSPEELLRIGTLSGAEALGRQAECGSISQGKMAHLIAYPIDKSVPPRQQLRQILETDVVPSDVWVAGQRARLKGSPS